MPHLILEYAAELDAFIDSVMAAVQRAALASGLMRAEDIKVRAQPFTHYRLHGPSAARFVHLSCRLLAGRSDEQKVELATRLRAALVEQLPEVHSLSVDIVDMDPGAYKKRVLEQC